MSDSLRDKRMRSETQISEQLDERLTMNGNKRYYKLMIKYFIDITFHNYSSYQIKVYPNINIYRNDSIERFGDDLTEEILQYLTFEDKIRLECVSKQWQRCVFNKQYVLELFVQRISSSVKTQEKNVIESRILTIKETFELLLKKCPNIKNVIINFGIDSSVLSLIGQYCPRIKSLKYYSNISNDNVLLFFRMYGHKLEEYIINTNHEENQFIQYCKNLKKIYISENSIILTQDEFILTKLENIRLSFSKNSNPEKMEILSDKYSKTIKSMKISVWGLNEEELQSCIECISRFENLIQLTLDFGPMNIREPLDEILFTIGQNCTKLLKLDFKMHERIRLTHHFFDIFYEFKAIKKLKIELPKIIKNTWNRISVECFELCEQLEELDINYPELREHFFANIATVLPKLQTLRVKTFHQFYDSFFDFFQSMNCIQRVELSVETWDYDMKAIGIETKYCYFGKSLSEVMLSPMGKNVKLFADNCGILIAQ